MDSQVISRGNCCYAINSIYGMNLTGVINFICGTCGTRSSWPCWCSITVWWRRSTWCASQIRIGNKIGTLVSIISTLFSNIDLNSRYEIRCCGNLDISNPDRNKSIGRICFCERYLYNCRFRLGSFTPPELTTNSRIRY